jgi:hypothetical protein
MTVWGSGWVPPTVTNHGTCPRAQRNGTLGPRGCLNKLPGWRRATPATPSPSEYRRSTPGRREATTPVGNRPPTHLPSGFSRVRSGSTGYSWESQRQRIPRQHKRFGCFPQSSVALGIALCDSRGRRFKSCPRDKVKPQVRDPFAGNGGRASDLFVGGMSADSLPTANSSALRCGFGWTPLDVPGHCYLLLSSPEVDAPKRSQGTRGRGAATRSAEPG